MGKRKTAPEATSPKVMNWREAPSKTARIAEALRSAERRSSNAWGFRVRLARKLRVSRQRISNVAARIGLTRGTRKRSRVWPLAGLNRARGKPGELEWPEDQLGFPMRDRKETIRPRATGKGS